VRSAVHLRQELAFHHVRRYRDIPAKHPDHNVALRFNLVLALSKKGWGLGRHVYDVAAGNGLIEGTRIALACSHQDQVITPPKGTITLARSAHTEHAVLAYNDAPVMSVQGHPEFGDAFCTALYTARRGKSLSDAQADSAIESLRHPDDNSRVGEWMVRFLRSAT
jgi:hypothetical protein